MHCFLVQEELAIFQGNINVHITASQWERVLVGKRMSFYKGEGNATVHTLRCWKRLLSASDNIWHRKELHFAIDGGTVGNSLSFSLRRGPIDV